MLKRMSLSGFLLLTPVTCRQLVGNGADGGGRLTVRSRNWFSSALPTDGANAGSMVPSNADTSGNVSLHAIRQIIKWDFYSFAAHYESKSMSQALKL
jgi:hypothetical protein